MSAGSFLSSDLAVSVSTLYFKAPGGWIRGGLFVIDDGQDILDTAAASRYLQVVLKLWILVVVYYY